MLTFIAVSCSPADAQRGDPDDVDGADDSDPGDGGDGGRDDGDDRGDDADDGDDGGGADDGAEPGDSGDDDDDDGPTADGIPCDVRESLAAECWSCHGDEPKFGAPMALRAWEDFQVPALTDATRPVYELLPERVGNDVSPMPPDGQISDVDMQRLVQWAAAGAPASDETCDDEPEPEPEPGVGPDELPCEVTHTFTAHANGSDDGFHVPDVDNLYQCFSFSSPLPVSTQITAWAPITDDERVLHHWILYRTQTSVPDGSSQQCDMPEDAAFVAGWAPGGENWIMPNDVGLEFGGPGDSYILQVHYNNVAGHDDAVDKSGVAFCTTEEPRPNTAGIIWLGTDQIAIPPDAQNHQVSGICPSAVTTLLPEPLTVIASFPHMHQLGRAMTTTINRLGGGSDLLVNADPFTFDNQTVYPHDPPIVVNQGDEMVTTCTFDNTYGVPVYFGEDTEDEMCFNFIMAYPVQFLPGAYRKCIL